MSRSSRWIPVLCGIAGLTLTACSEAVEPAPNHPAPSVSTDHAQVFAGQWLTVGATALSPDGRRIAVVTDDPADAGGSGYGWRQQGTTHLLLADVDSGRLVHDTVIAPPAVGPGAQPAFGADTCTVLVGAVTSDACRGTREKSLIAPNAGGVPPESTTLSRNGAKAVTVGTSTPSIMVWDTASGALAHTIALPAEVGAHPSTTTALSPDGSRVAVVSAPREDQPGVAYTQHLQVFDVATGRQLAHDTTQGAMFGWSIRVTDSGDVYVAGSGRERYNGDPRLLGWTIVDGHATQHPIRPTFTAANDPPALSADGATFVVQVDSGREPNRAYATATGAPLTKFPQTQGPVTFAPSTSTFVAIDPQGRTQLWPSVGGEPIAVPGSPPPSARPVEFSASSNRLILYSDGRLLVLDAATGQVLRSSP